MRLSPNERRLLRRAVTSAIENQTELIQCHHDPYTNEPMPDYIEEIKGWRAEIRGWERLKVKLSDPKPSSEDRIPLDTAGAT